MNAILLIALLGQSIELTVPETVEYSHKIRMSVKIPENKDGWKNYVIIWSLPDDEDTDIDSTGLKANTIARHSSMKVKVSVIFVYQDYTCKTTQKTASITVITPEPEPSPEPEPPGPSTEKYGLQSWTILQLSQASMDKKQARSLADSFTKIIKNPSTDKATNISNLATSNREVLGDALTEWIPGFLEPLNLKINPLNPKIKTVDDQVKVFTEIRDGLLEYSRTDEGP